MKDLNSNQVISLLNNILEYELAGVVKYTHFALMVTGPNRLILDKFFKDSTVKTLFGKKIENVSQHHALNYIIQSTTAELCLKQFLKVNQNLRLLKPLAK